MINQRELSTFKLLAQMQISQFKDGAIFVIVEGDTITWSLSSDNLHITDLQVGEKLNSKSCTLQAIKARKTLSVKLPRTVYGTRFLVTSMPIIDDSDNILGAVSVLTPRLHPVAASFPHFAPLLSEMFPEGVFLYASDLKKIINRQSSKKFDVPNVVLGYELRETDISSKTIRTKNLSAEELDATRYGVPVSVINYPLYDEDDSSMVVGTFGIIIPKITAVQLREMSNTIDTGLTGVSAAVEELAASAMQIHTNESLLNSALQEVLTLSEEINVISTFIKQIAEQTNMLGLNAAIEASRAGELGRGFSVVAKEMRKLSTQSKESVPRIRQLTDDINSKVTEVSRLSGISLSASQEQSAATEEITANIEEINSLAEDLNRISKNL